LLLPLPWFALRLPADTPCGNAPCSTAYRLAYWRRKRASRRRRRRPASGSDVSQVRASARGFGSAWTSVLSAANVPDTFDVVDRGVKTLRIRANQLFWCAIVRQAALPARHVRLLFRTCPVQLRHTPATDRITWRPPCPRRFFLSGVLVVARVGNLRDYRL
jgi:hypothetical protein